MEVSTILQNRSIDCQVGLLDDLIRGLIIDRATVNW